MDRRGGPDGWDGASSPIVAAVVLRRVVVRIAAADPARRADRAGAGGRGVPGLPCRDDWPAWNAAEMRAAVDYLEQAGAAATESGALGR